MIIKQNLYEYRQNNALVNTLIKPDDSIEYVVKYRLITTNPNECFLTDGVRFVEIVDVNANQVDLWKEVLKSDINVEVHSIPQLIEMDNLLMGAIDETFILQEQNLDMILMAIDELYNLFMGGEE